jgi:GH24 family phage-related lysozyme (muramidase)
MGVSKSIAGTLATVSNLNMLDRVTIASLGDLVQPFSNSNNLLAFWKGALRTGFTNRRETGVAKNLNQNLDNEIRGWLLKTGSNINKKSNARTVMGEEAVLKFDDATQAANVMGKMGPLRKVNEWGFKIMGLQWLTGLARRYAYNVGAVDAYTSANKLAKFVNAGGKLNSSKGLRLVKDLNKYSISAEDGLRLGAFNTFDDAVANKAANKVLNQSGILASNRDALIPQVQNRLLFAQSRNPWVRLMGQFTSWAMAKSAQTNKMLQRIENGEARQMVKLLAALPVYGGIQMLRELAKHGEVITDPAYDEEKWWAESLRLSGMSGILPELAVGRLTGPGSQMPWFIPFPAASVATDIGKVVQDTLVGDTDKAWKRFLEKIVPLPTYRKWLFGLWDGVEVTKKYGGSSNVDSSDNKIMPRKFSYGGIVIKRKKYNQGDEASNVDSLSLSNLQGIKVITKDNSNKLTNNDKYIVGDNLNYDLDFKEEKVIEKKTPIIPKKKPIKTEENSLPVMELNNTIPKEVINRIKINENRKLFNNDTSKIVHDSYEGGNQTIGYGHKLTDEEVKSGEVYGYKIATLTKEQAEDIFNRDLEIARADVDKLIDKDTTDPKAYGVLVEMAHQIGGTKLPGFKKMLEAINRKDYKEAANQMLFNYDEDGKKIGKTNWNKQTSERAEKLAALMSSINFDKQIKEFNIGGVVSKLVSKALVNRGKTAITSTKGTYAKANKIFTDLKKEKIHDFGSGKGVGSNEFKNKIVTSHEPFVPTEEIIKAKGKVPNYRTADEVILNDGMKSKDGIVNLNVLNVIESFPERNKVVEQIGKLLADDGVAVITTRSAKDVIGQAKKSKNAKKYLDGWLFGKGNSTTFQKGFGQKELEDYIRAILGKGFKVEKIPSKYDIKTTGILIKKLKEELV